MRILAEKIKEARTDNGMTIAELAGLLGVSSRSVSYYESGHRVPSPETLDKLCSTFQKTREYFVTSEDDLVLRTAMKFGSKGKKQAEKLITEANALFAGGELNDKDKELFLQAMESIYTESKERAKKYTPKKYLKD